MLAAVASAAAYLHLEDAANHGLLPAGVTPQQLAGQLVAQLPAGLAVRARQAGAAAQQLAASALPAAAQLGAMAASLPLRELLPHTTYLLCGAVVVLLLAGLETRQLRGAAAATAAAQVLLVALLQISERGAPLILLLALLQLATLARLLARRAELLPAGAAAGVVAEAGALLGLVAAQLFYVTGHLCEFAGLQYTAGGGGAAAAGCWAGRAGVGGRHHGSGPAPHAMRRCFAAFGCAPPPAVLPTVPLLPWLPAPLTRRLCGFR